MGLSGLVWLAQGWIVGSEGFSPTMSNAIVLAEVLDVVWMIWLLVVAWRMRIRSLVAWPMKARPALPPSSNPAAE
jgi:hypothetical protein